MASLMSVCGERRIRLLPADETRVPEAPALVAVGAAAVALAVLQRGEAVALDRLGDLEHALAPPVGHEIREARCGHAPQRRATQFPMPRRANVLRVRGRIADAR